MNTSSAWPTGAPLRLIRSAGPSVDPIRRTPWSLECIAVVGDNVHVRRLALIATTCDARCKTVKSYSFCALTSAPTSRRMWTTNMTIFYSGQDRRRPRRSRGFEWPQRGVQLNQSSIWGATSLPLSPRRFKKQCSLHCTKSHINEESKGSLGCPCSIQTREGRKQLRLHQYPTLS